MVIDLWSLTFGVICAKSGLLEFLWRLPQDVVYGQCQSLSDPDTLWGQPHLSLCRDWGLLSAELNFKCLHCALLFGWFPLDHLYLGLHSSCSEQHQTPLSMFHFPQGEILIVSSVTCGQASPSDFSPWTSLLFSFLAILPLAPDDKFSSGDTLLSLLNIHYITKDPKVIKKTI